MRMQDSSSTGEHAVQLRLTVEPIPEALANKNLRTTLLKSRWDKERKRIYAKYGYRCGICGVARDKGSLHCHEVFEYDDVARVQTLSKLIALCSRCHSVKHWPCVTKEPGNVSLPCWKNEEVFAVYREGNLKIGVALVEDHFMAVNGCDLKTMREHVEKAAEEWRHRSQHEWQTYYGEYEELVTNTSQDPN